MEIKKTTVKKRASKKTTSKRKPATKKKTNTEVNYGGRPPMFKNPEDMQKMIDDYFIESKVPTITGLALHLGFESRQSFYDYEEKERFAYTVKRARLKIENQWEIKLATEEIRATGPIFALKNFGWIDKVETNVNHTGSVGIIDSVIMEPATEQNKNQSKK